MTNETTRLGEFVRKRQPIVRVVFRLFFWGDFAVRTGALGRHFCQICKIQTFWIVFVSYLIPLSFTSTKKSTTFCSIYISNPHYKVYDNFTAAALMFFFLSFYNKENQQPLFYSIYNSNPHYRVCVIFTGAALMFFSFLFTTKKTNNNFLVCFRVYSGTRTGVSFFSFSEEDFLQTFFFSFLWWIPSRWFLTQIGPKKARFWAQYCFIFLSKP